MLKILAKKISEANVENFTSDFGLEFRKKFHIFISFLFSLVLRLYYKKKIIVDNSIKLDKNKNYIFAANHSFYLDGASIISTLDRNCYVLFGATEQLYFDICTLFIWLNGLIYVDRNNKQSRKDSIPKMNRVLNAKNNILIFPEGRWNDSENLLCQKLFAGVYNLSFQNKVEVVPVSVFKENYDNNIHVSYGEPLKLYNYSKDVALQLLRDDLAGKLYNQIEKYSTPFKRENIKDDIHFNYMNERMYEYSKAKWKSDYCWDDELFTYKDGDIELDDVWKDIDKVNINKYNLNIFYPLLLELINRKKYNFKDYMNKNYKKRY